MAPPRLLRGPTRSRPRHLLALGAGHVEGAFDWLVSASSSGVERVWRVFCFAQTPGVLDQA